MVYNFRETETKWQQWWKDQGIYKVDIDHSKPKFYVLDMFPYPSGSGLHVGHPLGYIASDIVSRFKRLKGFNVLHPMGYDAFGLPAEQYAIQTGQHPAATTQKNIARYREQLDKIGFSFDWNRELRTCDPEYYRWTQYIFLLLFNSWYNPGRKRAESLESLISLFTAEGYTGEPGNEQESFSSAAWKEFSEKQKSEILMNFRMAYLSEAWVNWCPALGTVLANDEVKDGVSERGGHPVERRQMPQWSLRMTSYAQRLLDDLDTIDWPESIKEAQRNWIGRSEGCSIRFKVEDSTAEIEVFTTRPDTIFGVTFLTLAPEHELLAQLTVAENREETEAYIRYARNRSERERLSDVKNITGRFTGAFALHPFTGARIPVWTGDYVLGGYGTGAVMAVPAGDQRDWDFAHHFNLPVKPIFAGHDHTLSAEESKEAILVNSGFMDGMNGHQAITACITEIEKQGLGRGRIQFRLRDAAFGRQRYWGEPIPVYYEDGIPRALCPDELPLILPEINEYKPTSTGEPPLGRAAGWKYKGQFPYELTTMPGWAGSSWYYLRYMDARNDKKFVSHEAAEYWQDVDLYLGGAEHATGHLLYVRFWTKFLYDLSLITVQEPARKLITQGMIQGTSALAYRDIQSGKYISAGLLDGLEVIPVHVDVNIVRNNELDIDAFRKWRSEDAQAEFILEEGKYICGAEVEKMSKSKWNVVNPDDIIHEYGADTFRLYEMFLGPLEQHKPWNTNGISGVANFIRKLWRLFYDKDQWLVNEDEPAASELKTLHKTIRKVEEDIERFSFNTSVSTFMIAVNELTDLKCHKRSILEPLAIILSPYAPHIAEELWHRLGHNDSVTKAVFPIWNADFLVEDSFEYPVSVNGKTRLKMRMALSLSKEEVETMVAGSDDVKKYLDGKSPKKVIVVPGRIVNIVV